MDHVEDPSTLLTKLGDDDLQVLRRLSSEGAAWIVGGWVRDGLSSTHNSDLDIATSLVPGDVIRIFPDSPYTWRSFWNDRRQDTGQRQDLGGHITEI